MKVYLSADIEGVAGIAHWNEATSSHAEYAPFRAQMTREVAAACRGAVAAGAREILVKDAHGPARNIVAEELPREAALIRGWSGHPLSMVQELDDTFDALVLIGYHSRAGSPGNPLAHTMSGRWSELRVGGRPVSEAELYGWAAAVRGVPLAFVSGDEGLCADLGARCPAVPTLATLRGVGASTISPHPALVAERIEAGVAAALRGDLSARLLPLPERLLVEAVFREPKDAYGAAFYPGAALADARTVRFEAAEYMDVLRFVQLVS